MAEKEVAEHCYLCSKPGYCAWLVLLIRGHYCSCWVCRFCRRHRVAG